MTINPLDSRKDRHEHLFKQDEKLRFRAEARCCKLFALWIAEQLDMEKTLATSYAEQIVALNMEGPGFDKILAKAHQDLTAQEVEISDHLLDAHLAKFARQALEQVKEEVLHLEEDDTLIA